MKAKLRRSGAKIMASLIVLLGSLSYIMILAVINGSVGFIAAMGVTVFGATGVAKALGILGLCAEVSLSWGWIIGLAVGCGVIRGGLRYLEQYSNHYIAFKLLAVLRDKIFGALRVLCPAKLESKQKGSIIAMITSDIETLEVFYAHTISPICIAVLVSLAVFLFVGFVASWYLALVALVGFIVIGIVVPLISSGRLKASGVNYRREFASFNAYFLDSIKGIKDIVLNNAEKDREGEVNRRSDILLKETKKMKNGITRASAATELMVTLFIAVSLIVGILLVHFEYARSRQDAHRRGDHLRQFRPRARGVGSARQSHADLCQRRQGSEPFGRKACGHTYKERKDIRLRKPERQRSCRLRMKRTRPYSKTCACTRKRAKLSASSAKAAAVSPRS